MHQLIAKLDAETKGVIPEEYKVEQEQHQKLLEQQAMGLPNRIDFTTLPEEWKVYFDEEVQNGEKWYYESGLRDRLINYQGWFIAVREGKVS